MNRCVVCFKETERSLCKEHIRRYRYIPEYDIYALKPRKRVSKIQTKLYKTLKKLLKEPIYQEVIFKFSPEYRFDIYLPSKNAVFEVHGQQHYQFNKFFHKRIENYEEQKSKDEKKKEIMLKRGYKYVEFSYIEKLDDQKYIKKKLILKGVLDG